MYVHAHLFNLALQRFSIVLVFSETSFEDVDYHGENYDKSERLRKARGIKNIEVFWISLYCDYENF